VAQAQRKLEFIARQSQQIDSSFEVVDEICRAAYSALQALDEIEKRLQAA
jgi:hypothetical protein